MTSVRGAMSTKVSPAIEREVGAVTHTENGIIKVYLGSLDLVMPVSARLQGS